MLYCPADFIISFAQFHIYELLLPLSYLICMFQVLIVNKSCGLLVILVVELDQVDVVKVFCRKLCSSCCVLHTITVKQDPMSYSDV